jgi:HJR/Mrr/RecB family endonuclease
LHVDGGGVEAYRNQPATAASSAAGRATTQRRSGDQGGRFLHKMQGGELASVAAKKISKVEQEWSREVLASPRNKGGDSSWPVTKKMEVGKGVLAL